LPAPDIEIGSRHPVNCSLQCIIPGICDPVHKFPRKLAGARLFFGGK
jgi:hypothetical protein